CPSCGLPSIAAAVCGVCLARAPPFAATIAPLTYAFPVDQLLQAFKYGGALALAEPLADELTRAVRGRHGAHPDAIIALPLSPARCRRRSLDDRGKQSSDSLRSIRVRRRPRRTGNSAQYRQRHTPYGKYRDRAAFDRAARIPNGRSRVEASGPRLSRVRPCAG